MGNERHIKGQSRGVRIFGPNQACLELVKLLFAVEICLRQNPRKLDGSGYSIANAGLRVHSHFCGQKSSLLGNEAEAGVD